MSVDISLLTLPQVSPLLEIYLKFFFHLKFSDPLVLLEDTIALQKVF